MFVAHSQYSIIQMPETLRCCQRLTKKDGSCLLLLGGGGDGMSNFIFSLPPPPLFISLCHHCIAILLQMNVNMTVYKFLDW